MDKKSLVLQAQFILPPDEVIEDPMSDIEDES